MKGEEGQYVRLMTLGWEKGRKKDSERMRGGKNCGTGQMQAANQLRGSDATLDV